MRRTLRPLMLLVAFLLSGQPSALAAVDPVTVTLTTNWATYHVPQEDDWYPIHLEPGELEIAVTPSDEPSSTVFILYDYARDDYVADHQFFGDVADAVTVPIRTAGEYALFFLRNQLATIRVTGPGLTIDPAVPAIALPLVPYQTWNEPAPLQATVANPADVAEVTLLFRGEQLGGNLLQADGSVAPVTLDPMGLADGTQSVTLRATAKASGNRSFLNRSIFVDRVSAFSDVPPEHWARRPIELLHEGHVVSGPGDGRFAPEDSVTRAEFAKMLAVTRNLMPDPEGPNPFADVPDDWAKPYILALYQAGLVRGEEIGGQRYFHPEQPIARAEAATIIGRAKGLDREAKSTPPFTDWGSVPDWAQPSVANLSAIHWLNGYPDGSYRPMAELSRAEAAQVLSKFLGL